MLSILMTLGILVRRLEQLSEQRLSYTHLGPYQWRWNYIRVVK
jgi:hypothetical protein